MRVPTVASAGPSVVWMAIGLAVYFLYGRSHSRLGRGQLAGSRPADAPVEPTT